MNLLPYSPVAHQTIHGSYRTPIWVENYNYAINVGTNKIRYFNEELLPDRIKSCLSMIHAFPSRLLPEWKVNPIDCYTNHQDKRLDDIGWQVSKNLYVLVLDQVFLLSLYGEKANG